MESKPQVFINFRGKDLRQTFVPHLKHHLKESNVNVFTDTDATGEPLKNLLNHIKNSRIVIVIFSISYLESKWCLKELEEIRKSLKSKKLDFVLPIFYKVRRSHVKYQSGEFGEKFKALKEKHPHLRIRRWKRALRYVSKTIGLTYEIGSSLSELDFIKNIVQVVRVHLTQIALKDGKNSNGNNHQNDGKTSKGEASKLIVSDVNHFNKLLHLSRISEALNLERYFGTGFMIGFAWKDLISSMQSSNSFEISLPQNSLHFHIDTHKNESLENAINWLALHMMSDHTQPALIFSNWDKLDQDTKNYIIYTARKKSHMLKAYNEGVDLKPFLSHNIPSSVQAPTLDKKLKPLVPQDWPCRGHKRAMSFHDNRDRFFPDPYEVDPYSLNQPPGVAQRDSEIIDQRKYANKKQHDGRSLYYHFRSWLCLRCGEKDDSDEQKMSPIITQVGHIGQRKYMQKKRYDRKSLYYRFKSCLCFTSYKRSKR